MKVGLFINTQYPEDVDVPAQIPALVEQVRVARDAGFRSLWFPHHWLTQPMQMLQQRRPHQGRNSNSREGCEGFPPCSYHRSTTQLIWE